MLRKLLCFLTEHKWEYTSEYESPFSNHVRSDRVCMSCRKVEHGWTGPTVQELAEAGITEIPDRESAYEELGYPVEIQEDLFYD